MNKLVLLLSFLACFILTADRGQAQILFNEDFSSGTLPAGWSNDSLGLPASHLWIFNNQYTRVITGANFDSHFAIFDSDEGNFNDNFDEHASLTTPDINITPAATSLFLELDQQYKALSGPSSSGSSMRIEYSVDAGLTWTTMVYDSVNLGFPNPAVHTSYDLTPVIGIADSIRVRFTYTGSWDWWWALDNVRLISRPNCTSPPNAGTALSTMMNVCPTDSFTLSLTGNDVGLGLSFQWQSSPDNTTWTDLTGDTSEFLPYGQAAAAYYRCTVTCSGSTSYSSAVQISMNPATTCYCVPIFTTSCETINNVEIGSLRNDSSGCGAVVNYYTQYPDTGEYTTDLQQGLPYTFTMAMGNGLTSNHGAGLWFDWNQNGSFQDLGEYFHISDAIMPNSGNISRTIIVPPFAQLGHTRMRVRLIYATAVTATDDCAAYAYGETEDYTVNVILPVGIEEDLAKQIAVYPSPAKDYITVDFGQVPGTVHVSLFDMMGERISMLTRDHENHVVISMAGLAGGIYFIHVESATGSVVKKVAVEK